MDAQNFKPPKFDKRTFMKLRGMKSKEEAFAFCMEIYRRGFVDGANADVDPSVHYMALKKGVTYVCGNCGAELKLEEDQEDESNDRENNSEE